MSLLAPSLAPTEVSTPVPVHPPGVVLTTLENGLTVIVREDHSAPVVCVQAWCKTGSIDEGGWIGAGLSHVLEHMLFKGTVTRGKGRIDQEIQEVGGYMNAYTAFDRTVYFINVPSTGASVAIDVLCDIMQNASLPPEELEKEMDVIRREMDMNQDDPGRRSSRRLFETAYTHSPYRFTIIGYPDIFNELKADDIRAYYRSRYVPNNQFFVVVGDITPGEVLGQIRKAFAKTKTKPLPPVVLPSEPTQVAAREVIEEGSVELGHLHFSWHIPNVRHPDVPTLDVLATLLGSGRSSRLFQELREKQGVVNYVDAWTYSPGDPGIFGVSAVVDGAKFLAARSAILNEIERVKTQGVTLEELSKAVKQFTAGTLATRKTMQGQAQDLGGSWMSANDLNFSERYLAMVKRVTIAEIQRVAREYLSPENRTLYALLPNGTAPPQTLTASKSEENPVQKFDLANGLRLLVKEDHRLPFVEFRAVFRGGVLAESPDNNGVTQMTAKMLIKGTGKRTAEQIATEIESLGGSIDTFGGNNSFGVSVEVLSGDFGTGLDLLSDVILHPTFPQEALERERQIQLATILSQKDNLLQSAGRAMRRALFGEEGYGFDSIGTEESVQKLSLSDLQRFHRNYAVPNNSVLAIYGDVCTSDVKAAVEKAFKDWRPAAMVKQKTPLPLLPEVKHVVEKRDKKQAVVVLGYLGSTLFNEDRFALELIQETCSDLGSRVFMRIRDQLGLAYYVGAQNLLGVAPGYYAFYAGTSPDKVDLVEQEFLKEAELLRTDGLTAEELHRSKAKILGQKKIAQQDLGGLALTNSLDELYGLGYANSDTEDAKFEAVTLEQAREVARKYLKPDAFVVSVVHPEE